jgi:hypothetical protein
VRVDIFESDGGSTAHAVIEPGTLDAYGTAAAPLCDQLVPEITDEVAVSRALHALADRLSAAADDDRAAVASLLGSGR